MTVQAGQTYYVEVASRAPLEDRQVALRVDFNTCSYAGDEAAVQRDSGDVRAVGPRQLRRGSLVSQWTRCAVTGLNLANKQLSLPLPATIGDLRNLQTLDLQFNRIPDPLPASLGNLADLQR